MVYESSLQKQQQQQQLSRSYFLDKHFRVTDHFESDGLNISMMSADSMGCSLEDASLKSISRQRWRFLGGIATYSLAYFAIASLPWGHHTIAKHSGYIASENLKRLSVRIVLSTARCSSWTRLLSRI